MRAKGTGKLNNIRNKYKSNLSDNSLSLTEGNTAHGNRAHSFCRENWVNNTTKSLNDTLGEDLN